MNSVNSVNPVGLPSNAGRARLFVIAIVALVVAFVWPLARLVLLALREEIQSHILLIPIVSLYLWKNGRAAAGAAQTSNYRVSWLSVPLAFLGLAALAAYLFWARHALPPNDALGFSTLSLLLFFYAVTLATVGPSSFRSHLFALMFLLFMIPLPTALIEFLGTALQRASAEVADWMLSLIGMPFVRDGLSFQFAGLSVRVAEECSGIRSTFVLFVTSILAGHLFLRTGWKKALLVFAIFPLGLLRNGFRITLLSWLTVNVDPGIIESPLHHRGGPIFFVASLIPLFLLLWCLRRSDRTIIRDAAPAK